MTAICALRCSASRGVSLARLRYVAQGYPPDTSLFKQPDTKLRGKTKSRASRAMDRLYLPLATCGVDNAGDVNALGRVGPEALHFLWRGHAHRAPRTRRAPR